MIPERRKTGIVKFYKPLKGYGFIQMDNSETTKNYFFFIKSMDVQERKFITDGIRVTFDLVFVRLKKEQTININAINVKIIK